MLEWLQESLTPDPEIRPDVLAVRLGLALALGIGVAGIYRVTQTGDRTQAPNLGTTLVLLAVLIAMVTQVIGNSVARAFSLVGALAIVRFRTVVEDTRDTAFVIFAVVVGMAAGAGLLAVAVVGSLVVGAAAVLSRVGSGLARPQGATYRLTVRLGGGHDPATLQEPFARHLRHWRLVTTATARQGAALDLTYLTRLRDEETATVLVNDLNRKEGVQSVELQRL